MTFLIDGYNLVHAVGLAGRQLPGSLAGARTRLLDWLADAAAGRDALLRVVFDGRAAPPSPEQDHRGVRVLFSAGRTADELIEELVRADPRPDRLAVVSNDNQVREAARRRGCAVRSCQEFVDWLIGGASRGQEAGRERERPESEKPGADATPEETAAWLAAFSARKKR